MPRATTTHILFINQEVPESKYDSAAWAIPADLGVVLFIQEMGKVKHGLAFNPTQARRIAAELLLSAQTVEDARRKPTDA